MRLRTFPSPIRKFNADLPSCFMLVTQQSLQATIIRSSQEELRASRMPGPFGEQPKRSFEVGFNSMQYEPRGCDSVISKEGSLERGHTAHRDKTARHGTVWPARRTNGGTNYLWSWTCSGGRF